MRKPYHIGFVDAGKMPYGYKQRPGHLEIHAVTNKDLLPTDLWRYEGERQTTKKALRERLRLDTPGFLAELHKQTGKKFTSVVVI